MDRWGPFSLAGKTGIVTGAAKGIGLGISENLAAAGANVMLADRNGSTAANAAERIRRTYGVRAEAIEIDVTDTSAGDVLCSTCVERFGTVDIVVNNAGAYPQVPLVRMPVETFDQVYRLNLRAVALISQAACNRMIDQGGGGRIINIASIDAFRPTTVGLTAYDATKGGVVMFTKALALEVGAHGIRVNAIAPGGVETPGGRATMIASGASDVQADEWIASFVARVPLGRIGAPRDIGLAAVYLASSAADYVTGAVLLVDGGYLLT